MKYYRVSTLNASAAGGKGMALRFVTGSIIVFLIIGFVWSQASQRDVSVEPSLQGLTSLECVIASPMQLLVQGKRIPLTSKKVAPLEKQSFIIENINSDSPQVSHNGKDAEKLNFSFIRPTEIEFIYRGKNSYMANYAYDRKDKTIQYTQSFGAEADQSIYVGNGSCQEVFK